MSTLPSQSLQCSHCALIFKSKLFLLEHLSKVHGLSVDTELPSLKTNTPSSNLKHNTNNDDSGGSLACRHCNFTASNWDVVDKHMRTFHQRLIKVEPLLIQKRYLKGKLQIIRRPGIKVVATSIKTKKNTVNKMSRPQHEDETGAKVNSSTSKAKCISNSSTDLKTYKRPSGPITKFLVPSSSESKVEYSPTTLKLPDPQKLLGIAKETLILHNPNLSTAQDSTGVLKVTATSKNDLCIRNTLQHIPENVRVVNDLLVRERFGLVKGSVSSEIGKRAHEDISVNPPKKRPKTDVGIMKSLESTAVEAKLSCSSNFAFEVSEDEDDEDEGDNLIDELDGNVDEVNEDHSLMYSCKHCRHGGMAAGDVLTHYEKVHPYIRCNSTYIKDPRDQTARFRCLECPVEYPYVADLRLHYRVSHPGAPDVFQMQSHALCFKCFVCPFTTLLSESLKDHYQKQHPSHIVINPLIYCKFNANIPKNEMSQVHTCKEKSIPKPPDQGSLKSAAKPDKEVPPVEMSQGTACEKTPSPKTADQDSLKSAATPDKEVPPVGMSQVGTCGEKSTPMTPDQGSLKIAAKLDKEVPPVEMSQVNTCEKIPSPKTADQDSFNCASALHNSVEATPPRKEPSSKRTDRELHRCKNCKFTHTSAVAMLVHYQKNHPERGVSIDQIKLAHVKSQTKAPLSPERNSASSASLLSTQMRFSDLLKESKDKTELSAIEDAPAISPPAVSGPFQSKCGESPGKCVNLSDVDPKEVNSHFFCQVCNYSDPTVRGIWSHQRATHGITQRNSEEIHLHTAAIRSRCKTSEVTIRSPQKIADASGIPSLFSPPQAEVFYCQLCDYYNTTMKGITGHLNLQHAGHAVTTVDILMYSAKVNQEKAQHKAMASASSSEADSSAKHENDATCPTNLSTSGVDLLFCQICHYGHRTVKGVLNHQAKKHIKLKRSADKILSCTSMIRRQIQESSASPTKNMALTSTGLPLPIIEKGEEEMLFCHLCNFRHNLARIIDHYKSSHPEVITSQDEIVSYSLGVHERRQKASNWGKAGSPVGKPENDATCTNKPSTRAADLFYCQKCNYGQPLIKSVLSHQTKRHRDLNKSTDEVLRYTSMIRRQIKELAVTLTSTGLPLPIIEEGDEEMLFCHMCNFPQKLVTNMLHHFKKVHPEVKPTQEEIVSYSFSVHKLMGRMPQMGMPAEQVGKCTSIVKGGNEETQASKLGHTASFPSLASKTAAQPQTRSLRCHKCTYYHPHIYLLKRHLSQKHNIKFTVPQILSNAFKDGSLLPGYHCEWCVFSHTSAASVYRHCQKKHPLKGISLKHIAMQLYAGPTVSSFKKKSSFEKKKPSQAQQSGKNDTKVYPCRSCSFKGSSLESISNHCREVHPWTNEEDCSVLNVNESDTGLTSRETSFQCPFCPSTFEKMHGLRSHIGIKHSAHKALLSGDKHEFQLVGNESTGVRYDVVYKCPRCAYVNTGFRGVLAHCQMRHPTLKAREDILQTTKVQFPNMKECCGRTTNLGGYMCRICPITRGSVEKLKIHYEQDHNQTAPNFLKPAPNQSTVMTKQLLSKYRSIQSSALQAATFKNKMPGGLKCNLCKHVASTKIGLSRHLNIHHKNKSEAGKTGNYTCVLCPSYSSPLQKYLGQHYKRIHGVAAFLKYYANVYNIRPYRKTLMRLSSTPAMDNNTHLPTENKKLQDTQCGVDGKAPEAQSEANVPVDCKKCNRTFRCSELLAIHFTHFHREDFKADFTVLNSKNYTYQDCRGKWYQCGLCSLKVRGTKKLCSHLDDHRRLCLEKANAVKMTPPVDSRKQPPTQPLKVKRQEELQEFETIEDLAKWNVAKVETFTVPPSPPPPSSPPSSPSSASKTEEQTHTRGTKPFACKECPRTFMSLAGLRVHEKSHAAMAELQQLDASFDKYISYRKGTCKPYQCGLCSYRTHLLGLARSHLVKNHGADISSGVDVTVNQAETKPVPEEPHLPVDLQEDNYWTEPLDEPEFTEDRVYSEPPDVQRQLGHYNLKRQASASAPDPVPQETDPPQDRLPCCELCNFSSSHLSSIRRHYLNRHGKKLLRCKDCSFFTGFRKTLEKHMELGHTNCPSEPTHQKDLRCPLCLYQSKNKNNMIDHVMLHREERVIPIEVRRSKLSRYLEGIVFRCHKCTFTCSSDENLRLHLLKHDDLKPYKCRLCFFDCTLLSDLEAHLCDKHQVVRNHELVGQINVDQLEARANKKEVQKKKAVEHATNRNSSLEQCNREDSPSEQCKEDGTAHSNVPVEDSFLRTVQSNRTVFQKQGQEMSRTAAVTIKKPELNTAVHQRHGQEEDTTYGVRAEHMGLNTSATKTGGTGEEDETCHGVESPDGPFMSCEEEQEETDEELVDAYEELPILDDKWSGSPERAQSEQMNNSIHSEHSYALPEQEGEEKDEDLCSAPALNGDDSTGDVVCGVVEEEVFVCTLCGRYLKSGAELERHVVQHGL